MNPSSSMQNFFAIWGCIYNLRWYRKNIIAEGSWIRTENLTENTRAFEKYYSQSLCLKCLLSTYINCLCLIETMWCIEMAFLSNLIYGFSSCVLSIFFYLKMSSMRIQNILFIILEASRYFWLAISNIYFLLKTFCQITIIWLI